MSETVGRSAKASLGVFFGLVFAISLPFWMLSAVADRLPAWFPDNLPVSALQAFCPLIAAAMAVYREDGSRGLKPLKRAFDLGRVRNGLWYARRAPVPRGHAAAVHGGDASVRPAVARAALRARRDTGARLDLFRRCDR